MAAPSERPTCPTSADFRIAGIQVGRCAACGQLARVYGGRLIAHPTLRRLPAAISTGARAA